MLTYSVNYNARAKHIRIKVNGLGKVGVVAPHGVSSTDIHCFVEKNTAWIYKTIDKLKDDRLNHIDLGFNPPENIFFKALSKQYIVEYLPLSKKPCVLENEQRLAVYTSSKIESVNLLRAWVQRKAKQRLVPWLHDVSVLHNINFNNVTIRGQKTRWGSCSGRKNISLNRNLLFLAPELVNYLMVHELSHILHLNHSKKFWMQVASCEPNYQVFDKSINQAHKIVPLWAYTP